MTIALIVTELMKAGFSEELAHSVAPRVLDLLVNRAADRLMGEEK